jgi:epoxide hydrolase-like predicted phosphatase
MRNSVTPALIIDYGGVLTRSVSDSHRAWCESENVDLGSFESVLQHWTLKVSPALNPIHLVETGQLSTQDFELLLASRLNRIDGTPVHHKDLLARIFECFTIEPEIIETVRRVHATVPTALLTNSWGSGQPWTAFADAFDTVIMSRDVRMRKPNPEIYRTTARSLSRQPSDCLFIDDSLSNVAGAHAVGMPAFRHTHLGETIQALDDYFAKFIYHGDDHHAQNRRENEAS